MRKFGGTFRITALCLGLAMSPGCQEALAKTTGWQLEQNQRDLGHVTFQFDDKNMKFATSLFTAVRAPDGKMVMYSEQSRRYKSFTIPEWRRAIKIFGSHRNNDIMKFSHWQKKGTEKIAGLTTNHYQRIWTSGGKNPNQQVVEDGYFCQDIKMAQVCKELLPTHYEDSPGGIILRFKQTRIQGKWKGNFTLLDTVSVKKATLNPSDFLCPKGYQRAESEMEVIAGGAGDMGGMGGIDLPEPGHKSEASASASRH